MKTWKETFDKTHKPLASDIESFFTPKTMKCFSEFSNQLNSKTGFYIEHAYTKSKGWIFKIGPKNLRIADLIIINKDSFYVNDYCVKNIGDIDGVVDTIISLSNHDFKEKIIELEAKRIKRNHDQIERTRKRLLREKDELAKLSKLIVKDKFNIYKWAPRVSLVKLKRLYQSSASFMLDTELLDDIGFTFYCRCLQGKEERELYYNNKLKCHHCYQIISFNSRNDFLQCECGYQYIPREYGRSYQNEWMPHGKAQPVFDKFLDEWPKAKTPAVKMNLIDWIIHECHKCMITNVKAHSIAKNLLGGKRIDAEKLILELAYGDVLQK